MSDRLCVYPWQQAIWQHLTGYIEQQRIPQALLLTGVAGLGKRHLADVYAASLLCQTPSAHGQACGYCVGCRLYQANTHPDYLTVEPDEPGKAIGIDKVRQLIVKLALKPQYDAYRLVIFQPADALNNASANAFLKCLEEPSERTCIILISDQPSRLPATIRSRCQKIHCQRPDGQAVADWLRQQGINEDIDKLLRMAQGAPLLAKHYGEHQFVRLRRECFEAWQQVADGKGNLLAVAEQWQKQETIDLSLLLGWVASWLADMVKLTHGIDGAELENPDFKKSLQALAERLEFKGLYRFYDSVLVNRSQLTTQINKQLLTERLLIDWSQLNHH
ncbi:MAG: DNA polymerase III subunit delta' [Methylomonas sp.]